MSRRVTRASAARLEADITNQTSPSTTETGSPPTQRTPVTRKRKAADNHSHSPPEARKTKKARGSQADLETPESPDTGRKKGRKRGAAAMSSAGYVTD